MLQPVWRISYVKSPKASHLFFRGEQWGFLKGIRSCAFSATCCPLNNWQRKREWWALQEMGCLLVVLVTCCAHHLCINLWLTEQKRISIPSCVCTCVKTSVLLLKWHQKNWHLLVTGQSLKRNLAFVGSAEMFNFLKKKCHDKGQVLENNCSTFWLWYLKRAAPLSILKGGNGKGQKNPWQELSESPLKIAMCVGEKYQRKTEQVKLETTQR